MGLCNYSELNERIQEFVLPLSPTLHTPPLGRQLSPSEALSTEEDVIGYKDVVNAFITRITHAYEARMMERADMLIACPRLTRKTKQQKHRCSTESKSRESETKQKRTKGISLEDKQHQLTSVSRTFRRSGRGHNLLT